MDLESMKNIVGTCASLTTMIHMLSGTLICRDFYKTGTSKNFDPTPFVGGVGMCILMLRYALILQDSSMIAVNIFGSIVNILYMIVYIIYSPNKAKSMKFVAKTIAFVLVVLTYAEYESKEHLKFRYGCIVTILLMLLIASPFLHLKDVIRTKDTSILPFPLILMGTLLTFQWLLYGYLINDKFTIIQNIIGFLMSAAQLSLFAIYPSKYKDEKKSD